MTKLLFLSVILIIQTIGDTSEYWNRHIQSRVGELNIDIDVARSPNGKLAATMSISSQVSGADCDVQACWQVADIYCQFSPTFFCTLATAESQVSE